MPVDFSNVAPQSGHSSGPAAFPVCRDFRVGIVSPQFVHCIGLYLIYNLVEHP